MDQHKTHEPRWPAAIALVAVGCLWLALPQRLSVGPAWLLLSIILALLLPIVFSHRRGHHTLNRILTLAANGVTTLAMILALIFLVGGLPRHRETPETLLRSAGALLIANVLVFSLWDLRPAPRSPPPASLRAGRLNTS